MTRRSQLLIARTVGVVIGCQLTTACTTAPDRPGYATATQRYSGAAQNLQPASSGAQPTALPPATTSSFNKPAQPVTFAEPQPTISLAPSNTSTRQARLIGLYGELSDTSFNSGAPFDGGSNLAQNTFATEGSCVDPDIDRTGTWLAFASTMHRSTSDIYIKSVTGKTQTQLTTDPADDVMPTFSPDSKTIAFASNRSGNWDIYTTTFDGGTTVQITNDTDHELHPTFSPDGRSMAYCKFGSQSQRWEIWTVDVNNPGVRNFLEYGVFPQWCPDPTRSKIAFQRAKQRGSREYSIWTIDVISGQAKFPTEIVSAANAALINPAWSPDGSRIVFVSVIEPETASSNESSNRPAQSDLWVVNVDGTERTMLTNGQFANFQPVWAADGSVFFISDRSGSDNVWAVNTNRRINTSPTTHTVGVTGNESATAPESHP